MFYCEACREKNDWPDSIMTSRGRCEVCGETANCYDRPSSSLPDRKVAPKPVEEPMAEKKSKLTPPDEDQCQCDRPNGHTFMTFGGAPGYVRCRNTPIVIVTEREVTNDDGERGSMSLCAHCFNVLIGQKGDDFATVRAIEREGDDKGVR